MARDGCNGYFSFWTIFCPFNSLTAQKVKIEQKKKQKKPRLELSSFYNSVPKIMITCYTVPATWCMTDINIFHFGPFFELLPS